MLKRWLLLPLVAAALLAAAGAARAQSATPTDNDVNRVARQLFCPVCENIPLDVCATQACADWRTSIRDKLAAGWTDQQIMDYFVAQYGERVLAKPSTRGLNILIWILPPLTLLGGILFLWNFLRRASARPVMAEAAPTPPPAPSADKYVEQLEKELEKRR